MNAKEKENMDHIQYLCPPSIVPSSVKKKKAHPTAWGFGFRTTCLFLKPKYWIVIPPH